MAADDWAVGTDPLVGTGPEEEVVSTKGSFADPDGTAEGPTEEPTEGSVEGSVEVQEQQQEQKQQQEQVRLP